MLQLYNTVTGMQYDSYCYGNGMGAFCLKNDTNVACYWENAALSVDT